MVEHSPGGSAKVGELTNTGVTPAAIDLRTVFPPGDRAPTSRRTHGRRRAPELDGPGRRGRGKVLATTWNNLT